MRHLILLASPQFLLILQCNSIQVYLKINSTKFDVIYSNDLHYNKKPTLYYVILLLNGNYQLLPLEKKYVYLKSNKGISMLCNAYASH